MGSEDTRLEMIGKQKNIQLASQKEQSFEVLLVNFITLAKKMVTTIINDGSN